MCLNKNLISFLDFLTCCNNNNEITVELVVISNFNWDPKTSKSIELLEHFIKDIILFNQILNLLEYD